MKKYIISILLIICTLANLCLLSACAILNFNGDPDDVAVDGSVDSNNDEGKESIESEFELTPPPKEKPAIIHMIQPIGELTGWQAGKTEFSAKYYVDDMMDILDSLDWKDGNSFSISGDFDFRINLYRTTGDLEEYKKFFDFHKETTEAVTDDIAESTIASQDTTDKTLSVQYLINYKDRIVNMRLSDYSAQTFDIYAEIGESEMKMLVLCLKYYFGPAN